MKRNTIIILAVLALFLGFSLAQTIQLTKLDREAQNIRREIAALQNEQEYIKLQIEVHDTYKTNPAGEEATSTGGRGK